MVMTTNLRIFIGFTKNKFYEAGNYQWVVHLGWDRGEGLVLSMTKRMTARRLDEVGFLAEATRPNKPPE